MTPTLSNPQSEELKTLKLAPPFKGVYKRHILHQPEGVITDLLRCRLEEGVIQTLVPFIGTPLTTVRMPWLTGNDVEEVQGHIPGLDTQPYMLFTDLRIHEHPFSGGAASPVTFFTIGDTWTKVAGVGTFTATVGGIVDIINDGAYDMKISPDAGTTWYTVIGGTTLPDTIVVSETAGAWAGVTLTVAFKGFTDHTAAWYGPRYTYFGDDLIVCGKYATYHRPPGGLFAALTNVYRGRDVINFAGRPVLIGAVEATSGINASTPTPGLLSERLQWPTRTDYTNWTGYGSGFLFTHDDGANHRAACVWGEDAYLFTSTSIYRLVELGQTASNPIGVQKFPVKNYDPPISNVVQGRRGLYFWSVRGPCMFDGRDVIPLYDVLEKDPDCYDTTLNDEGVYVWADIYSQSIRFYNQDQPVGMLRYTYWEKTGAFTTLDNNGLYLAGICEHERTQYWGLDAADITANPTEISILMDEENGTLAESGVDFPAATATWRGISFEEGSHVNKIPRTVRVVGLFRTTTVGEFFVEAVPTNPIGGGSGGIYAIDVTGDKDEPQEAVFEVDVTVESPSWDIHITFPVQYSILEVYVDYNVGSDTDLWPST